VSRAHSQPLNAAYKLMVGGIKWLAMGLAHTKTWLAMEVVGAAQGINIKWRAWPQAAVAQAGDRHTASSGSIC